MAHVLILYGSTHGQTERIVNRMGHLLREGGLTVTTEPADRVPPGFDLAAYDAVLVAASVYFGRHQRPVERFARAHAAGLARMPTAFLSVCGALGGSWAQGPAEAAGYRADFARRTGWSPDLAWSLAGAVAYTKYALPIRLVMKFISMRTGRPTDTSRDHEFTDWAEVDRLAGEFAAHVQAALAPA